MSTEKTKEEFAVVLQKLLEHYGENPQREGLLETPKRYLKFLDEFLIPKDFTMTTFTNESYDEMLVESNIPFYSLCEHHTLPFFGTATIAYIPNKKIVGLSKIPRVVDKFAHRLQNQERITNEIVDFLMKELDPMGVAVALSARHFCMEMRGVKKHGAVTQTIAMQGVFKTNPKTRDEFLRIVK